MQPEITDWLRSHDFSASHPAAQNDAGMHPLILACQQGRCDIAEFLIGRGADVGVTDQYGNNALWAACHAQDIACLDAPIDAGIDIDHQNPVGATALMFAASSGRERIVARLLAAGANPDLKTHDDFTALDLASTGKILKLLRTPSHLHRTQLSGA